MGLFSPAPMAIGVGSGVGVLVYFHNSGLAVFVLPVSNLAYRQAGCLLLIIIPPDDTFSPHVSTHLLYKTIRL